MQTNIAFVTHAIISEFNVGSFTHKNKLQLFNGFTNNMNLWLLQMNTFDLNLIAANRHLFH